MFASSASVVVSTLSRQSTTHLTHLIAALVGTGSQIRLFSATTMAEFYGDIRAPSGAFKYFVNGQWRESSSGKTVAVTNPTTLQKDYQVQACTQEEVNNVFAAAKAAQLSWAKTPLWKRAEYLHRVAALMREHAQPMADCLVKEIAKPAKDSVTGVLLVYTGFVK